MLYLSQEIRRTRQIVNQRRTARRNFGQGVKFDARDVNHMRVRTCAALNTSKRVIGI